MPMNMPELLAREVEQTDSALGTIYIGAPVEQASERAALAEVVARLEQARTPYIVIANIHVGGRQIDCIAATPTAATLIEVKTSNIPVRGDLNGPWARQDASGLWRPHGNAYQQALSAKNALRDALSAIKPLGGYYPDAVVLFAGGLPGGSQVTLGDFKVRVTSLADFAAGFPPSDRGSSPLDLGDWRSFAASLSLTAVSLEEAVGSVQVRADLERLRQFNKAVADEYGRDGDRWLEEDDAAAAALHEAASNGGGCVVVGPSGCGKTLMVKSLAARLAAAGSPVLFFAAKDFTGEWSKAVHREIALLTDSAPGELLRAMGRGPNPVFLIVDGINELAVSEGLALRGLRALARRLDAKIVLTSQAMPEGFGGLSPFHVDRPSAALKRRIAARGGWPLSDAAIDLLKVVGSGFEAEMIGGVGAALAGEATRLALIDQFVRVRLGPHARSGAFALRCFASALHGKLAFSMAEARFDELMRGAGISFESCDAIFAAGLLVRRVGRVSFFHEMIFNACAAFGLAETAAGDPESFGARLSTPVLKPLAGEIITAIEDAGVCRRVLEAVTNSDLIAAAAVGSLGPVASTIARQLIEAAKSACIAEIQAVSMELDLDNPAHPARWGEVGRREWTQGEVACLGAIGRLATSPAALRDYLDLCAVMDTRLLEERIRLEPALKAANIGLRSSSFALAYYGFGSQIGFTKIGHHGPRDGLDGAPAALPRLEVATLSSGQLHFYLESRRSFFGAEEPGLFAEELIYVLRHRFAREPYHLQLAILHAVTFARKAPNQTLAELTAAVDGLQASQSNRAISSSIIDALKFLGALEEEGESAREGIRSEIAQALADDADGNDALSVYTRMFDHPFDSIYYEEIHALTDGERHTLYRRALGSADVKRSLSLSWLTDEIAKLDNPADGALLARFAALPDRSNLFPQEEWGAFTVSLRFLGRHGLDLPPASRDTPTNACLSDISVLVHAAESRRPDDLAQARAAWDRLDALPAGLVVGCLSEVHAALTERYWAEEQKAYGPMDLRDSYAKEALRLARRFMAEASSPEYFHNVPMRERGPALAFDTLGRLGDRTDIETVRRFGRAHRYSSFALEALKALDRGAVNS